MSSIDGDPNSAVVVPDEGAGQRYILLGGALAGLIITGISFAIASWRVIAHFIGYTVKTNQEGHDRLPLREGMTMRRMFHVLFWIAMVLEIVGYTFLGRFTSNTVNNDVIGYTLLYALGRSIFEFNAFAVVTLYWFRSTATARAGHSERKMAFKIFPCMLIAVSIVLAIHSIIEVTTFYDYEDTYHSFVDFKRNAPAHRRQLSIQAIAWCLQAVMLIICGTMMYQRLSKLSIYSDLQTIEKLPIISRRVLPQIGCILAYELRSLMFVSALSNTFYLDGSEKNRLEESPSWWILEGWIPSTAAAFILFYALRKRDRINLAENERGLPPQPPLEAFISFRSALYEDDNDIDGVPFIPDEDAGISNT